jgi:hypothetical protein
MAAAAVVAVAAEMAAHGAGALTVVVAVLAALVLRLATVLQAGDELARKTMAGEADVRTQRMVAVGSQLLFAKECVV